MAISTLTATTGGVYGKVTYVVDTETELANLPTGRTPGSIAQVTETQKIYVLNGSEQWVPFAVGGSGGGGSIDGDFDIVTESWIRSLFGD